MNPFKRIIRLETPTITEQEKRGALAVPESTPLWAAVIAIIGEHIEDATNITRAAATAQQPTLLAHQAGGLDALLALREDLAARREDALKSPEAL